MSLVPGESFWDVVKRGHKIALDQFFQREQARQEEAMKPQQHLKLPGWEEDDPLQQLKAIRKEIDWAFDDWCRDDDHQVFRLAMADLIKQLTYLQPFIDGVSSWYDKPTERLVACAGPSCSVRRVHHERPDTPRGTQYVRVPLGYDGQRVFCSLECQSYFKGKKDKDEEAQTDQS